MKNSLETFSIFLRRFSSGTLLSRFSGFGREVVMATLFGVNALIANFWMAFRFAHLLRRFFAEGAMHISFLPHFMQLKEKNPKEAAYFFYELTLWVTAFLLTTVIVADLIMTGLLFFGNLTPMTKEVVTFTLLLSPSLIFISLYGLNCSFLHTENRFFLASITPSIVNITWIIGALVLARYELITALERLAIIIVFGFALQYIATLPSVMHFIAKHRLIPDKALSKHIRGEMRKMLTPFLYAIIGVMATQLNSALDMLFAKAASPEGPAYLWYAIRLQQLPLALFGVGLATVLLPAISKNAEQSYREKIINFALSKAVVLMVPITAAFLVMGGSMVQLVFGHGKFTAIASYKTTSALSIYALGLLPMTLVMILASWFYGKKETKLPALCALVAVAANTFLNALFVFGFKWGIESIAWATTISAFINLSLLFLFLLKEGVRIFSSFALMLGKVVIATFSAALTTVQVRGYFFAEATFTTSLIEQIAIFSLQAGVFTLVFFMLSYLLRLREFTELIPLKR